jgi:hypothetical protein
MPFDQLPNDKQAMIFPATATATTMAESTPRPAITTRCYLRQVICQCTHHVGDRIGSVPTLSRSKIQICFRIVFDRLEIEFRTLPQKSLTTDVPARAG